MSSQAAMLRAGGASVHYDHLLKLLLIGDSGACARDGDNDVRIAVEKVLMSFTGDAFDARGSSRRRARRLTTRNISRAQASARVACCCDSAMISLRRASSPPLGASRSRRARRRDLRRVDARRARCGREAREDGGLTRCIRSRRAARRIDFKIKTVELGGKRVKLQIWDTAGQERFRTITTAYYRGAMGILLVYDVSDEKSFENVRGWMRNIEMHASSNVNKILIGNKCDVSEEKRVISVARGQALADEFGIPFAETSAKSGVNVTEAFMKIAGDIRSRMMRSKSTLQAGGIALNSNGNTAKSKCC